MQRKYTDDLVKWLKSPRRKPLMVWGARQVGKSYLILELFAEKYFKNKYIYVDCATDHEFVKYCEDHVNAREIINYLTLDRDMIIDKDTLIIFDEAQECLPVVTLMKYFCQEYREIPIIVTGSMVRIKILRDNNKRGNGSNKKFLFPIGKINQLTIYPLNFEEFVLNKNKILYESIVDAYNQKRPLDEVVHKKAIECFYDYLLVGGMPEAVDTFLETGSYQEARKVIKEIYDNYLGDMILYQASSESVVRTKKVYENIYSQLNKESKNFKVSLIEKNTRGRDFHSPIDWLTFSYLVYKSSLIKENITLPLTESNESLYRLYLSDVGLFSLQSKINAKTFISNDTRNELAGVLFENYVAIELINAGFELYYWKGKSNSEFEFVIQDDNYAIPIDVKKSKGTLSSLEKFKEHNHLQYAVKVSMNNYGYNEESKILTIPFYEFFMFIKQIET